MAQATKLPSCTSNSSLPQEVWEEKPNEQLATTKTLLADRMLVIPLSQACLDPLQEVEELLPVKPGKPPEGKVFWWGVGLWSLISILTRSASIYASFHVQSTVSHISGTK